MKLAACYLHIADTQANKQKPPVSVSSAVCNFHPGIRCCSRGFVLHYNRSTVGEKSCCKVFSRFSWRSRWWFILFVFNRCMYVCFGASDGHTEKLLVSDVHLLCQALQRTVKNSFFKAAAGGKLVYAPECRTSHQYFWGFSGNDQL